MIVGGCAVSAQVWGKYGYFDKQYMRRTNVVNPRQKQMNASAGSRQPGQNMERIGVCLPKAEAGSGETRKRFAASLSVRKRLLNG